MTSKEPGRLGGWVVQKGSKATKLQSSVLALAFLLCLYRRMSVYLV